METILVEGASSDVQAVRNQLALQYGQDCLGPITKSLPNPLDPEPFGNHQVLNFVVDVAKAIPAELTAAMIIELAKKLGHKIKARNSSSKEESNNLN